MKFYSFSFTFAMVLICSSLAAQNINESKSFVKFEISNMKFKTVEGTFTGMKGNVSFQPLQLEASTMNVCLNASSVNTENEKRDEHLRKEDFFHTNAFPEMCFSSSKFEFKDGRYSVTGNLLMHGVSKEVCILFTQKEDCLIGSLAINRLDYGLGEETGTFMVGNEVLLEITCFMLQ